MLKLLGLCVVVLLVKKNVLVSCEDIDSSLLKWTSLSNDSGPGEPLFLTPLLKKGMVSEAQKRSVVKPFANDVVSHAGYFTVDERRGSNLFFWFFRAEDKNWENLPVAVWLQGGPGASSLLALFIENGPYVLEKNKVQKRLYSWHKKCNMIFIDNPVGAGYSFTEAEDGYPTNQTLIGQHLFSAIKQFFLMFPNLAKNDFFLTGESYAGKYVPSFAYTIHKNNMLTEPGTIPSTFDGKIFINLKGLLIGNGLVDPVNMLHYGDYLYQLGLIDKNMMNKFHFYEGKIKHLVDNKRWDHATELFGKLVLRYVYYPWGSMLENSTGFHEHYNYINLLPPDWTEHHEQFVTNDKFRRAVHVGNKPFDDGKKLALILKQDIMKSVIDKLEVLLDHYRVVLYNGQLDIICAYPLTVSFIQKMKWSKSHEYEKAERHIWKVDNEIAGYYKTAGNLVEVLVRDAGHMVPSDKPLWAYYLFNKVISKKDLSN